MFLFLNLCLHFHQTGIEILSKSTPQFYKRPVKSVCHLLALLGAHHILHISRERVNITTALKAQFFSGGKWSAASPGRNLPTEKSWYPFYKKLCGPQGRSGWAENLVPTRIRSRIVQPVASRYTDWATGSKFCDNITIYKHLRKNFGNFLGFMFWISYR